MNDHWLQNDLFSTRLPFLVLNTHQVFSSFDNSYSWVEYRALFVVVVVVQNANDLKIVFVEKGKASLPL